MKFILLCVLAIIGSSLAVPFAQNEESVIASPEDLTFNDLFPGNETDTDSERIVGGAPAPIARFPWQISVRIVYFTCSGALISQFRGLTLASCVAKQNVRYRVIAGSTNAIRPPWRGYYVDARPILHPQWLKTRVFNVAVLELARPAPLGQTIRPIALPAPNAAIPYGVEGVVSGWGSTGPEGSKPTPELRYTVARTITNQQCNQIYGGRPAITNDYVCAGVPGGGRGPCRGDTGNPLVVNGVLMGLVANSRGCGQANAPAIYTRIPAVVEWIRSRM